jgi:translation initiation factor 3 subunit B
VDVLNAIDVLLSEDACAIAGFCLIQYANKTEAVKAMSTLDNFQLDAKHKFSVFMYDDVHEIASMPDEFQPPRMRAWEYAEDSYGWLNDWQMRDQLVLRYASGSSQETHIYFVDSRGEMLQIPTVNEELKEQGRHWCDRKVQWSPSGLLMATFHPEGVLLWGGTDFREMGRFPHKFGRAPDAGRLLFSPCERYLAIWSGRAGNPEPDRAMVVVDIRTGLELRAFRQVDVSSDACNWTWSADGEYIARIGREATTGKELLQVYKPPSMEVAAKMLIAGAQEIHFAPAKHSVLAYWSSETQTAPTTVTLLAIPSKAVVRTKQLFNAENIKMHWQP